MPRNKIVKSQVEKQKAKCESRKRHQLDLRGAMAVSDYLLLAATDLHRQATEFVDRLQEKYPNKRDVRKTYEFRDWQRKQILLVNKHPLATEQPPAVNCQEEEEETVLPAPQDNAKKEMVLRIPLIHNSTKPEEIPTVPNMPVTVTQEDKLVSIFDDIPDGVMSELIAEIRADPTLNAIMNDFGVNEEVMDEGIVPENIYQELDIDIEIPDPLEDEMNNLLYF